MSTIDPSAHGNYPPDLGHASVPTTSLVLKAGTIVAIFGLVGFIAVEGAQLYREWSALNRQLNQTRRELVVGYSGINPSFTEARFPANWIQDQGEHTLLWAGWDGQSHQWFRIGRGEIRREQISTPMGRDVIRAIDEPLVEVGGGPRWDRIPDEAPVVGLELSGNSLAYPLRVLEKVEVVNDLVGGSAFLVVFSPFVVEAEAIAVFESVLEGKRINLGLSGYFIDRKPLLYDRDTQSLWVRTEQGLTAIAGTRKGANLKEISRPMPVSWGDWRSRNPNSRLVVGADRTRRPPLPTTIVR